MVTGRFGIGGKNTTSKDIINVFENMFSEHSKKEFTIGIIDDVYNLSLNICNDLNLEKNVLSLKGFFNFYSFDDCSLIAYDNSDKVDLICTDADIFYSIGRETSCKRYYELKTELREKINEIHFELTHNSNGYGILVKCNPKLREKIKLDDKGIIIELD